MTGPEHYRRAEELLGKNKANRGSGADMSALAEAQVHATLALAAATAYDRQTRVPVTVPRPFKGEPA